MDMTQKKLRAAGDAAEWLRAIRAGAERATEAETKTEADGEMPWTPGWQPAPRSGMSRAENAPRSGGTHVTVQRGTGSRPLRVAAYIRVSTRLETQEESFETQEAYFTGLIASTPGWAPAGIYTDYGVSATGREERIGFKRLLRHCAEGRVDRILCKSISRFARDTEELLAAVRTLHQNRVTILFEKENIDMAAPVNEFVLTTLAALAQEESRSLSENLKSSLRMRFTQGQALFDPIYGYRVLSARDAQGNISREIVVEPREAEVVRYIYGRALGGSSFAAIARELNTHLVPYPLRQKTTRGRQGEIPSPDCGWNGARVANILRTERYTGDARCQKTFRENFRDARGRANTGQVPQYTVYDHHPAIVSRGEYERVQRLLEDRQRAGRRPAGDYVLSGRVVCGQCGRVYHVMSRPGPERVWVCPLSAGARNTRLVCDEPPLYEIQLLRAVRKGFATRFRLEAFLFEDGAACASPDDFLLETAQSLEQQAIYDTVETDRAFLRRRLDMARRLEAQSAHRLTYVHHVLRTAQLQQYMPGGTPCAGAELERLARTEERCRILQEQKRTALAELEEEALRQERYWSDLERDQPYRVQALAWLRELPRGLDGVRALLKGVSGRYLRAWVMRITVHSAFRFTLRWFDGTETEAELDDNPADCRAVRAFRATGKWW